MAQTDPDLITPFRTASPAEPPLAESRGNTADLSARVDASGDEARAVRRARRQAVALMIISSCISLLAIYAMWLGLRALF
ncbi:MAG TPA: hypothetical protein VFA03_00780 [Acetobacteraceae bacterium]|nr:hypothetical protein [Acetobacteraceae bacterium]